MGSTNSISSMRGGLLPLGRISAGQKQFSSSRIAFASSYCEEVLLPELCKECGAVSIVGGVAKRCLVAIGVLLFVTLIVRSTLLENFFIPSSSMVPALEENEHVIVSKLAYGLWLPGFASQLVKWGAPERGEVVVFTRSDDPRTQSDESKRTMVKRVVAVGGDAVLIKGTTVSVNGVSLKEPYVRWAKGGSSASQAFLVPDGKVFVLGDNRDESFDSRYWSDPFVEQDRILGPVTLVY